MEILEFKDITEIIYQHNLVVLDNKLIQLGLSNIHILPDRNLVKWFGFYPLRDVEDYKGNGRGSGTIAHMHILDDISSRIIPKETSVRHGIMTSYKRLGQLGRMDLNAGKRIIWNIPSLWTSPVDEPFVDYYFKSLAYYEKLFPEQNRH